MARPEWQAALNELVLCYPTLDPLAHELDVPIHALHSWRGGSNAPTSERQERILGLLAEKRRLLVAAESAVVAVIQTLETIEEAESLEAAKFEVHRMQKLLRERTLPKFVPHDHAV